ncbi:MAG: hypothetical protein ACJAU0_000145 [Flavobacteriales bacterium]|jgi:hypothetical protein
MIGAWTSNLGNRFIIREGGDGWSNGDYSRKVWVRQSRPKLIFAAELNALRIHPRTTFFIEIAPTTFRDTLKFGDFIIPLDQTYMKLINEDFNEEYFRRDSL